MLHSLFQRLFAPNKRPIRTTAIANGFSRQLRIESLEERRVLSTSNVVFLYDETFSTADFQKAWLSDIVTPLDSSLELAGITNRQYGLVGFGDEESFEFAHSHVVDPGSDDILFGTADKLLAHVSAMGTLNNEEENEDGWDAIEHAVAEYNFDPGAAVLFVLIQNEDGHTVVSPLSPLTEKGIFATLESQNISLTTVVEADFVQDTFTQDLFGTGGVVYGVEADENDGSDDNQHTAYVDNPVANNGLPANVFSDDAEGGPHRIHGAHTEFEDDRGTDDHYVRMGWNTGGSAWNIDVVRQGQNAAPNTVAADQLAEFNGFFVDSLTDQVTRKIAAGDVAPLDVPLVEINVGGPAIVDGAFNFLAASDALVDPLLGSGFLPTNANATDLTAAGTIASNGNSVAEGLPLEVFKTARAKSFADDGNLEFNVPASLVPDGSYVVEFLFSGLDSPGFFASSFSLDIEGERFLTAYNTNTDRAKIGAVNSEQELPVSQIGKNVANVKRFRVDVVGGNGLQILLDETDEFDGPSTVSLNGLRILQTPEPSNTAPHVTDVIISGSNSNHEDYSFDQAGVVGSGSQLGTVPVGGADRISVRFNEPVIASIDALVLNGYFTGQTYAAVEFTGSGTSLLEWTFAEPFTADMMSLELLDTEIVDLSGQILDGEWISPADLVWTGEAASTFPSGNGVAGGKFVFFFTILPGDFNGDNVTDMLDVNIWIEFQTDQNWIFNMIMGDADGDGDADLDDLLIWQTNYLAGLDFTSWS